MRWPSKKMLGSFFLGLALKPVLCIKSRTLRVAEGDVAIPQPECMVSEAGAQDVLRLTILYRSRIRYCIPRQGELRLPAPSDKGNPL